LRSYLGTSARNHSASATRLARTPDSASVAELATNILAEPASEAAPVSAASSAALPLSDRVVASTLRKIGYPCGSIASKSAVEGSAGVYSVTCTSGHTYRATPINGRYRFRKAG
jgi:hypothetical protein